MVWGRGNVLRESAEAVKAVGARHFIISSDLGQPNNPLHPDGLMEIYKSFAQQGISLADIALMSKTNPALALGLSAN